MTSLWNCVLCFLAILNEERSFCTESWLSWGWAEGSLADNEKYGLLLFGPYIYQGLPISVSLYVSATTQVAHSTVHMEDIISRG